VGPIERNAHPVRSPPGLASWLGITPSEYSSEPFAECLEGGVDDVLVGLDAGTARFSSSLDAPMTGVDVDEPHAVASDRLLPVSGMPSALSGIEDDLKQGTSRAKIGCSQMQVSRSWPESPSRFVV
jgi:hypothetical protein